MAILLVGCGENPGGVSGKTSPPKQQVENLVRAGLPPFLTFRALEIESIPVSATEAKVNFKAEVLTKEPMLEVDRVVEGAPEIVLLRVVQREGETVALYGSVMARRTMDIWELGSPGFQSGLDQLGRPRGSFGPNAFLAGSAEAEAEMARQRENAQRQTEERLEAAARRTEERLEAAARKRAEEAQMAAEEEEARLREMARQQEAERQERERMAELQRQQELLAAQTEKRHREKLAERAAAEAAEKQKLAAAFAAGTKFTGSLHHPRSGMRRRIVIEITGLQGDLVSATIFNPDQAPERRTFSGQIAPVADEEKTEYEPRAMVLSLSPTDDAGPIARNFYNESRWELYTTQGKLELWLGGNHVIGTGEFSYGTKYELHFETK